MYHRGCPRAMLCLTTQGHRCPWLSVPGASGHLFATLSWNPLLIERQIPSGRKTACPLVNILPFRQSDSTSFQGYPSKLGFGYTPVCAHTLPFYLHFHMIDKPLYTRVNQYTYTQLTMCTHLCIYTPANNQTHMYTCSYSMLAHTYNIPLCIHAYPYTCTCMCRIL